MVGQRTWDPKGQGFEQAPPVHVYIQIYFQANKLQIKSRSPKFFINSNNSSTDCKKNQPEMEFLNRK